LNTKRLVTLFVTLGIVSVLVLLPIVGCAQSDPAPEPAPAPTPETFELNFQTFSAAETIGFDAFNKATEDLDYIFGDRLKITLHPGGTLAPMREAFDACSKGVIDGLWRYGGFDAGIDFGFGAQASMLNLWANPREVR
jgi:hypothetical protein